MEKEVNFKKRKFLKNIFISGIGINIISKKKMLALEKDINRWTREAMFYSSHPKGVRCGLCPNECYLSNNQTGICQTRININGKLYTLAYGNPCAVNIDPIEKKPLYHFFPGSEAFSLATAGCNFSCLNCQNYQISQVGPQKISHTDMMPEQVVENCQKSQCASIAYTYTEPTVFYEYMYETAKLARQVGIYNVMISNGYINPGPLKKILPYLDAANIDIKSFDNEIYKTLNGGKLQPVLNTLKILKDNGIWLEITNLIVPTFTNDLNTIKKMCDWLIENGFSEYPLHFSRFFPTYKLNHLQPTPLDVLKKAYEIAINSGIKYVYLGNISEEGYDDTKCSLCKKMLIERKGYRIIQNNIEKGKCKFCQHPIHGKWNETNF